MMNVKPVPALVILVAISFVFLVVAFAVCQEDEANEGIVIIDPNCSFEWEEYFLSIDLKDEPTFEEGEDRIYLYKGDDFDIVIEKSEPNEPIQELTRLFNEMLDHEGRLIDIVGICIERIERLEKLKSIPTWPDYIELEKTLHLYWEDPNPDPNSLWNTDSEWVIGKGTKIYFKED